MSIIKPLWQYPQTPMDTQQSELFLRINMMAIHSPEALEGMYAEMAETVFTAQILESRIKGYKIEHLIPTETRAFIVVFGKNPGGVMLFLQAAYQIAKLNNKPADLEAISFKFHTGFPNERDMKQAWDDQKNTEWHNKIDTAEAWT